MLLPRKTQSFRFITIFSLVLLVFSACKDSNRSNNATGITAGLSDYIYAYSSGTISRADDIKIQFNMPIVGEDQVGKNARNGLLSVSPSVKGELIWENTRTLSFSPSDNLPYGKEFNAQLDMKKLFDGLPQDARTFSFNFRTKEQYFEVLVNGINSSEGSQQIEGTIQTADVADLEDIQKVIAAKQSGKPLNINVSPSAAPNAYDFVVEGVQRGNSESNVTLSWDGKNMGVKVKGDQSIAIPAVGDFKVVQARVVQDMEQYIIVNFSDPIDRRQDLEGLISLKGIETEYRYDIDGNMVRVYPSGSIKGEKRLLVSRGLKNTDGKVMENPSQWDISFQDALPEVRLVGGGTIVPNSDGLIFPFDAINLNAVEVEIFKIYENNLLQFLQSNNLNGNYQLERVGKVIYQKKVSLSSLEVASSLGSWKRYALDLSPMISKDPKAIYQVRIGFRPEYSNYYCGTKTDEKLTKMVSNTDEFGEITSFWGDYYGINGYYEGYNWRDREDPCKDAYYNYDNFIRRNVLASNLGITAKQGSDNSLYVAVSNLITTDPISGAEVEVYDYQQQLIQSYKTDSDGILMTDMKTRPYFIVVNNGQDRGYLKLDDGNALSLSRFDVSGAKPQNGLKGFLYGERGVWRPGDSIFLNFILEDKENLIPDNHPVTIEIHDARGNLAFTQTNTNNLNGVYDFSTATSIDAPTGSWRASVKVGGATFTDYLRIETIKPNRLKINLDFGKETLNSNNRVASGDLEVNWLHGAPAKNLKAKVEMQLQAINTTFDKFEDYEFDDPARFINTKKQVIFDKEVDSDGKAKVSAELLSSNTAPGKLSASFKTRAFENGGDFSTNNFSMTYSPYASYVGIKIPKDKYGGKELDMNKTHNLPLAVLDENGKPVANRKLEVGLYRTEWRWWWDSGRDNLSSYNSANHNNAISKMTAETNNKGAAKIEIEVEDWGRYLVRVCDTESGHCTGDFFWAGYPWSDGDEGQKSAYTMLNFTSNAQQYEVGQTIELNIPASSLSRGLVTIEDGTRVLETRWFKAKSGNNQVRIQATKDMAPNVYAHVSLMQPHANSDNDLPIRTYGVIPIMVEDKKTRLNPQIAMPEVIRPEEDFTIEVKEKEGKAMTYTIAVVDEGILDLTNFSTPEPHSYFYAREALGTKTWDMYDDVLGAYGGDLERILSIGGGAPRKSKGPDDTANRFKPVVKHLGPFYLKGGKKAKHTLKLENYVGSVRTMVVAANNGAYGQAEETTPVKKPLMLLTTLPRVLSPTETLTVPVNVFAMEKGINDVSVTLETNDLIEVIGEKTKQVNFSKPGDEIVLFDIKVRENVGVARFKISASAGSKTASEEIELEVRNPNPIVTNVYSEILDPDEAWTKAYEAVGMYGTNAAVLEVSNIPPIDLGRRLNYLLRYPHGCIEQTTSSGFPQLYVGKLLELNDKQKNQVPKNIEATIDRLQRFQTEAGGFAYWPGDTYADSWGSNYAGHFLLEAKALGYTVSESMLSRWIKYQKNAAKRWDPNYDGNSSYKSNNALQQSYRLYTLALAGKADIGAMNRLRESKDLNSNAKWRLAAAYAMAGKNSIAKSLIENLDTEVKPYRELSYTYGTALRDRAMILETLTALDERKSAAKVVQAIAANLNSQSWLSTQETAYALLAVGKFVGDASSGDKLSFAYAINGGSMTNAGSNNPISQNEIPVDGANNKQVVVKNTSKGILYVSLILSGKPVIGDQTASSNDLKIAVTYKGLDGKSIDPKSIPQGTDFIASLSVTNPGTRAINYQEMALTQIFPSGWEIINSRMDNVGGVKSSRMDYQDIRDDRVYTYFDIPSGNTQTYNIQLNAAYQGRYYLPTVSCEAMYDNTISARQPGEWVEVVAPTDL